MVRLDRVQPVVLERVRPDLVGQPDPAALLAEVEQDPVRASSRAGGARPRAGRGSRSAGDPIASPVRHSEWMRTGHRLAVERLVAVHERRVLLAVDRVPEADGVEVAVAGRQLGGGGDADADVVLADALAVVGGVALEEGVEDGEGHAGHQWGRVGVGGCRVGTSPGSAAGCVRCGVVVRRGAAAAARVDHEDRRRARRRCSRRRGGRPGPRRGSRPDRAPRCGRPGSSASGRTRTTWCSSPWWAWTPVAWPGRDGDLEDAHVARRPGVDLGHQGAAGPRPCAAGPSRRTTRGGVVESSRSHAAGTSSAPAIAASASSDGSGLLVLDLARGSRC